MHCVFFFSLIVQNCIWFPDCTACSRMLLVDLLSQPQLEPGQVQEGDAKPQTQVATKIPNEIWEFTQIQCCVYVHIANINKNAWTIIVLEILPVNPTANVVSTLVMWSGMIRRSWRPSLVGVEASLYLQTKAEFNLNLLWVWTSCYSVFVTFCSIKDQHLRAVRVPCNNSN